MREEQDAEARCGRCRLLLSDQPHKKFAALNKDEYVHPADRRALAALRVIPGIDTALKKLLEVTGESAIRVIFTASAVKVTKKQCPDLYAKLQVACTTLGVDMPELFVQQSPIPNAFTGGVKRPVIVLYSALLDQAADVSDYAICFTRLGPASRALLRSRRFVGDAGSARSRAHHDEARRRHLCVKG